MKPRHSSSLALLPLPVLCVAGSLLPVAARADTLAVGSAEGAPGAAVSLPFRFSNTHAIVGIQFDLVFPAPQVDAGEAEASSATTNHKAVSRGLAAGKRRIVVYSTTNQLLPDDLFLRVPLALGTGSAAGGPTMTVSNLVLTDKRGRNFTPTLSYPKLDTWRRSQFTAAELENAAISGDDQDPDGDGVINLGEYLAGTSPKHWDAAGQPDVGEITSGGIPYFTLTWRQDRTASAAAALPQVSTDAAVWSTSGVTAAPTGGGDTATAEWRALIEKKGNRQFIRLNFTRTPAP